MRSVRDLRVHSVTASSLMLLLISCVAYGQATSTATELSGTLAKFGVTGSQRFSAAQIEAAAGLKPGQAIRKEDLQAAADRLAQSGVFANVQFRFATEGKDVTVEFQVSEARTIGISFDNFPWFTDDELVTSLKASIPVFDTQLPEAGGVLDEVSQALEKILPTRNVSGAVSHKVVREPGTDAKIQQFRVDGAALTVEAIEFDDPLARDDLAVRQSARDVILGKPYSRAVIERFDFEQVRPLYLAHACLRVHFGEPMARFKGDPTKALPDHVTAIVTIDSGPEYRWAGVTWSGNSALSNAELNSFVQLKDGDMANGVGLEAAWVRISDAYANRGYLDAKLDPTAALDDSTKRAAYRVAITEGPQYHMGELVLTGLSLDGERRIRAAWKIPAGAVFDQSALDDFIDVGARRSFDDIPFNYEKIGHYLQKDPSTGKVDVLMDFQ
ncbi:MAG: POTRA domain-containing protein [Candidatus Acidiferrales bacterium]